MRAGRRGARGAVVVAAGLVALLSFATTAGAQDSNILLPTDSVERLLRTASFDVLDRRGSRGAGDRTSRVALSFEDGSVLAAKWAVAPEGGGTFNNNPRFELGAYKLQQLFLEPDDHVVPPTVIRAFPLHQYRELHPEAGDVRSTFRDTRSVLVVLQYWLYSVSPEDFWDSDRFEADSVYARHFADFNLFTYLARHSDENEGNYLISQVPGNPRVFSVDNGVAFSSRESDRGYRWRRLRVDRLPATTVERLRALTRDDVDRQLATLAEFRVLPNGVLQRVAPGPPLDPGLGLRHEGDRIQLGLTRREIDGVWNRLQRILGDVHDGDIEVF